SSCPAPKAPPKKKRSKKPPAGRSINFKPPKPNKGKRSDRMPDDSLVQDSLTATPEPLVAPEPPPPADSPHENYTTLSEYLESLLVTVILALFGTSFVVQAFKIPSPSMEKTLLVGDHLLVNKFIFG